MDLGILEYSTKPTAIFTLRENTIWGFSHLDKASASQLDAFKNLGTFHHQKMYFLAE